MSTKEYLTCAETAKLVRSALKAEFPGVKFSVRSDTYSGGASIRVKWTDGPTASAVDAVVGVFSGADFDGMIDLKVYCSHWLHPDGSVSIAKREGTNGSFTEIIGDPLGPSAKLVHFGADFIFTVREISPEWKTKLQAEVAEFAGDDTFDEGKAYNASTFKHHGGVAMATGNAKAWGEYGGTLVHQLSALRDRYKPCDHSTGTYPVGAGVHRCAGCGMRCSTAKEATS